MSRSCNRNDVPCARRASLSISPNRMPPCLLRPWKVNVRVLSAVNVCNHNLPLTVYSISNLSGGKEFDQQARSGKKSARKLEASRKVMAVIFPLDSLASRSAVWQLSGLSEVWADNEERQNKRERRTENVNHNHEGIKRSFLLSSSLTVVLSGRFSSLLSARRIHQCKYREYSKYGANHFVTPRSYPVSDCWRYHVDQWTGCVSQ